MSQQQRLLYRAVLEKRLSGMLKSMRTVNASVTTSSGNCMMNMIMHLRKCCNHPYLINGAEEHVLAAARAKGVKGKLLATTASLGPVMQEVRLQISAEHKTRVRIWRSKDPAVGGRIELAHRIGVLEPQTEVASRFAVSELHAAEFFSEDIFTAPDFKLDKCK